MLEGERNVELFIENGDEKKILAKHPVSRLQTDC